jgi:hypothetical protein
MNFPTIETYSICWGLGAIGMNERREQNKVYLLTIAYLLNGAIGIWNEIWNEISSRGSRALLLWGGKRRSDED